MEENEGTFVSYEHECSNCFFCWVDNNEKIPEEKCEYCVNHPNMSLKELIERKISILNYSLAFRFPNTFKEVVEYILERLPED